MSQQYVMTVSRALVLLLCAAACRADGPRAAGSTLLETQRTAQPASPAAAETLAVAPLLPSAPAADWKLYHGDGIELRYPPDAAIAPDTSYPAGLAGVGIRGPRISLRSPHPDLGTHSGPAYALVVSTFANPTGRSLEAWVDSVRRETSARIAPDDPDSLAFLAPPATATVAGQRALVLHPFCGDCQPEEVYIAGPGRVVVFSKLYDLSFPGDQAAQGRLYDAILSTLRWKE